MKAINKTYIIKATLSLLLLLCANTAWGYDWRPIIHKNYDYNCKIGLSHSKGDFYTAAEAPENNVDLTPEAIEDRFGFKPYDGYEIAQQQTHVYEQTIYMDPNPGNNTWQKLDFIDYYTSGYELGYSRWYVWNGTREEALYFKRNFGVNDDGYVDYDDPKMQKFHRRVNLVRNINDDIQSEDDVDYRDGVLALDFKNREDSYVNFHWDGRIRTIAVDFAHSNDVAIKMHSYSETEQEYKVNLTEPTLAYRYLIHIKGYNEFKPLTFKYTATAGMYFQTMLGQTSYCANGQPVSYNDITVYTTLPDGTVSDSEAKLVPIYVKDDVDDEKKKIKLYMLVLEHPEAGAYKIELKTGDAVLETYNIIQVSQVLII